MGPSQLHGLPRYLWVLGVLQLLVSITLLIWAAFENRLFPWWTNLLTMNAVVLNHAARELQRARNTAYEAIAELRLRPSTTRTNQ